MDSQRALVRLLTAITILFALLVVGFAVGALAAMRAVREARAQVARLTGVDERGRLGAELVERQQAVARHLSKEGTAAEEKIQGFQARLNELYPIARGLTRKLDQSIALTLLMNDQMILMNHQIAELQQVAAGGVRPLKGERAIGPGTGTGGSGGGEKQRPDERRRKAQQDR